MNERMNERRKKEDTALLKAKLELERERERERESGNDEKWLKGKLQLITSRKPKGCCTHTLLLIVNFSFAKREPVQYTITPSCCSSFFFLQCIKPLLSYDHRF